MSETPSRKVYKALTQRIIPLAEGEPYCPMCMNHADNCQCLRYSIEGIVASQVTRKEALNIDSQILHDAESTGTVSGRARGQ